MKDFILKHPIITLIIVEDICIVAQNMLSIVVIGKPTKCHYGQRVIRETADAFERATEANDDSITLDDAAIVEVVS